MAITVTELTPPSYFHRVRFRWTAPEWREAGHAYLRARVFFEQVAEADARRRTGDIWKLLEVIAGQPERCLIWFHLCRELHAIDQSSKVVRNRLRRWIRKWLSVSATQTLAFKLLFGFQAKLAFFILLASFEQGRISLRQLVEVLHYHATRHGDLQVSPQFHVVLCDAIRKGLYEQDLVDSTLDILSRLEFDGTHLFADVAHVAKQLGPAPCTRQSCPHFCAKCSLHLRIQELLVRVIAKTLRMPYREVVTQDPCRTVLDWLNSDNVRLSELATETLAEFTAAVLPWAYRPPAIFDYKRLLRSVGGLGRELPSPKESISTENMLAAFRVDCTPVDDELGGRDFNIRMLTQVAIADTPTELRAMALLGVARRVDDHWRFWKVIVNHLAGLKTNSQLVNAAAQYLLEKKNESPPTHEEIEKRKRVQSAQRVAFHELMEQHEMLGKHAKNLAHRSNLVDAGDLLQGVIVRLSDESRVETVTKEPKEAGYFHTAMTHQFINTNKSERRRDCVSLEDYMSGPENAPSPDRDELMSLCGADPLFEAATAWWHFAYGMSCQEMSMLADETIDVVREPLRKLAKRIAEEEQL